MIPAQEVAACKEDKAVYGTKGDEKKMRMHNGRQ
jgi:hypothetical protein